MKKIYTFCFLAASMIITPGVAFAGQSASQNMNQTTVIDGSRNSVNVNGSQSINQYQSKKGHYPFCSYSGSQSQSAQQNLNQGTFVAGYGNTVGVNGSQSTNQSQLNALRAKYCY